LMERKKNILKMNVRKCNASAAASVWFSMWKSPKSFSRSKDRGRWFCFFLWVLNLNKGVCHTVALPFTSNSILRQKKN
jgi:hypothetical protein